MQSIKVCFQRRFSATQLKLLQDNQASTIVSKTACLTTTENSTTLLLQLHKWPCNMSTDAPIAQFYTSKFLAFQSSRQSAKCISGLNLPECGFHDKEAAERVDVYLQCSAQHTQISFWPIMQVTSTTRDRSQSLLTSIRLPQSPSVSST